MSNDFSAGDLNRGNLVVRLITFGIPLALGMFFHSLFGLVDLIIVGKLGADQLAAVNTASLINLVPMLVANGINNASIAVIARNFGMRNYRRANANTLQGFLVLVLLALALGWPSYVYAAELNQLVGSTDPALGPATEYLQIQSAGLFTMFALMQVTAVLRAGGNSGWPMFLLIGANVLNVFLDIALVHGVWGFPMLEAPGAAWGTVIARGLFAIFGLYLITRPTSPVKLILRRIRWRPRMAGNLVRIGIPSSLQYVVRVVAYGALLNMVTKFGDGQAMHAALAVGFRLDILAIFTGAGFGAAAAAMVGQALGAGLRIRAARTGWFAAAICSVLMVGMGAVFWFQAPWLMAKFGQDPRLHPEFQTMYELGIEYLRISVIGYAFAGIAMTLAQALNGAGSTKMPLLLDAVGFLAIQVPMAYYVVSHHAEKGYDRTTLWWGMVAVTGLVAVFYAIVWKRGHWKDKKIQ